MRKLIIGVLVALVLIVPTSATLITSGPTAYYGPEYDREAWHEIYNLQTAWGNAVGPPAGYGEYWCAHASYDVVGVRLLVLSGGAEFVCVTGDTVQQKHKAEWFAKWGLEASWELFTALPDPGYVEVYAYAPRPTIEELAPPEVATFEQVPYVIANGFLFFWLEHGGLPIFGLPLSDEHDCLLETGEQGVCQYFERARMEVHPDGQIRLGRVGYELLEAQR